MWKYYSNISQIGYFILYIISLFSLFISPISFSFSFSFSFIFSYTISSTHVVSLSPPPSFPFSPSFKSPALLPSSVKKFSSTLFFSPIRPLCLFFFFFHTLSLYLYPPSFICFLSLMRSSHSPALSLCVFFFYFFYFFYLTWFIGHYGQSLLHQFSTQAFPPNLGRQNLWARERKFSPGFSTLPIFLSFPNNGKHCFLLSFPLYVFHPP